MRRSDIAVTVVILLILMGFAAWVLYAILQASQ